MKFQMMPIIAWVKRYSFSLWAFIIWLILCVPQNVVTVVMYFHQDFKIPLIPNNFTCYEAYKSIQTEIKFWVNGIFVTLLGCFGVIGNLFTALVLKRLATKSGFNRLLFCLGKKTKNNAKYFLGPFSKYIQSNLVIRNVLIRNKLALRNLLWITNPFIP